MDPSRIQIGGHVYIPVVPQKLRQGGRLAELLSRTFIKEEHTCSFIPLCGLTSRFYFNKVNHGCIQQGLSSTSYVLVTMLSLEWPKWTADVASSFMELIVYWGRQTLIQWKLLGVRDQWGLWARGVEDTVLAQVGDVSPFSYIWEVIESKTDDGQQKWIFLSHLYGRELWNIPANISLPEELEELPMN